MPRAGDLVAVLLLMLSVLGAEAWLARPAAGRGERERVTLSDAELEKAIRERFARSKIGVNRFTVRVQGGVATIEGRTEVVQHKGVATRLAKAAGARRVVNRIEIAEEARRKASGNLAQGRRRAQIKRSETAPRSGPR
ncbi:MAG: BON domain-containing protein [Bryobacterales bacterium]|nr:BON domain-containing protein [Bryobacteraceae bacterium]MDW8130089.1 BON domain-containing protein [Bryobacterales bacterium]